MEFGVRIMMIPEIISRRTNCLTAGRSGINIKRMVTSLFQRNVSSKSNKKIHKQPAEIHQIKAWNTESLRLHGKLLGRVSTYNASKAKSKGVKINSKSTESTQNSKKQLNHEQNDLSHLLLGIKDNNINASPVSPNRDFMCKLNLDFLKTIESVPLAPGTQAFYLPSDSSEDHYLVYRRPSVSKILDITMPPEARAALERWKMNQISILGLDGFNKMQMETLARGKNLHSAIQALFSGQREAELDISEELSPYWNSLQHVFMEARSVKHLEGYVIHPTLHYAGYFDCIAYYKDKLCLIDWKTSTKQKPYLSSTFDNPLQLAAYAGAVNSDSRYNLQIKECLLVIAYADGSPAHAHLISEKKLQKYWEKWLQRVREHWQLVIPERRCAVEDIEQQQ